MLHVAKGSKHLYNTFIFVADVVGSHLCSNDDVYKADWMYTFHLAIGEIPHEVALGIKNGRCWRGINKCSNFMTTVFPRITPWVELLFVTSVSNNLKLQIF